MKETLNRIKSIIRGLTPNFLISFYHLVWAFAGAAFYGSPSRKIKVIGVTGTNGKSTTMEMIYKILTKAGFKTAVFSSISFRIGEYEEENTLKMTMPGRAKLQKLLKQAVEAGCKYAIMEVTSEGIKQHRHKFIDFETAVFTNLSPEHIEAHGSFENYRQAKEDLFKITKGTHVLNSDDENIGHFAKYKAGKKYAYGLVSGSSYLVSGEIDTKYQIQAIKYNVDTNGAAFEVNNTPFRLKLLGAFNIYNALAAICVGLSENVPLDVCSQALAEIKIVPGRMEIVISEPFTVIVDYAFTPNALDKVYKTLKSMSRNSMICVLGAAGGGRDKWKRPKLGELAGKHCQKIIVTNEDPYDEDPMEVINQVAEGTGGKAQKVLDRRQAINRALGDASPGDVVIITGKGSEPWICVANGKKIAWDDRRVVREEFEKISKK